MRIEANASLRHRNTFAVEATAKWFAEVRSADDFRALLSDPRVAGERKLVLGGGSNILFSRDFAGLVVKNSIPGIEVLAESEEHVRVRAAAGEAWHDLVMFCVERDLGGLENLSLIPGLVGAAPIQNIGAYGVDMAETCESVEALHLATGERALFAAADCEFGYRDSIFKRKHRGQFLITGVTLRLSRTPSFRIAYGDLQRTLDEMRVSELTVKAVSDAVIRIRSAKLPDPRVAGNAGSFFQNPVIAGEDFERLAVRHPRLPGYPQEDGAMRVPAGWLIEACGWKGKTLGRAGVHAAHALVLVNRGGATGEEVLRLAAAIQRSVQETFGIDLVPEVNLV